jgi:hypothetical protein
LEVRIGKLPCPEAVINPEGHPVFNPYNPKQYLTCSRDGSNRIRGQGLEVPLVSADLAGSPTC